MSSGQPCPSNSKLTCFNPLAITSWSSPPAPPNQTACSDSSVQRAALAFAEKEGWFTFEQGIQDGADVLAGRMLGGAEQGDSADAATLYQSVVMRWGSTMVLAGGDMLSISLQSQSMYRAYLLQPASQRTGQSVTFNQPLLAGMPRLLPSAQND